jgi:hypothetical protein
LVTDRPRLKQDILKIASNLDKCRSGDVIRVDLLAIKEDVDEDIILWILTEMESEDLVSSEVMFQCPSCEGICSKEHLENGSDVGDLMSCALCRSEGPLEDFDVFSLFRITQGGESTIEAAAIPLLVKAVDFLMDEGRKYLVDRKNRKIAKKGSSPHPAEVVNKENEQVSKLHDDLLQETVDEMLFETNRKDIESCMQRIEIHSETLRLLKDQKARSGPLGVDPKIHHSINATEQELEETMKELQKTVSKVYGKRIQIPELT